MASSLSASIAQYLLALRRFALQKESHSLASFFAKILANYINFYAKRVFPKWKHPLQTTRDNNVVVALFKTEILAYSPSPVGIINPSHCHHIGCLCIHIALCHLNQHSPVI